MAIGANGEVLDHVINHVVLVFNKDHDLVQILNLIMVENLVQDQASIRDIVILINVQVG